MKIILQKNAELNKSDLDNLKDLVFSIEYYNNEKVAGDIFVGFPGTTFKELEDIKGLKFIQSLMAGYDHVDLEKIKSMGIIFANATGVSGISIAEYVLLKILDYYKDAQRFRDNQSKSFWEKRSISQKNIKEVSNQKALILGTGDIGSEIAKRLKAFEVEVIGINRSGGHVLHFDQTYAIDNMHEVLSEADIVVGALPLTTATKGLYNKAFFSQMKTEAIFINIGRGSQLVVEDLLKVLETKLSHVYLDVVPNEPLSSDSLLWKHPKVSLTPHISSSSNLLSKRLKDLVLDNIYRFEKDEEVRNKVV